MRRADLELIAVSTILPVFSIILAYDLSSYIGAPGTGNVETGLKFALFVLALRIITFAIMVYAILKGYERLVAISVTILVSSLTTLLFLAIAAFYLPAIYALALSIGLAILAFTKYRAIFQIATAIAIGVIFALVYPLYAIWLFSILLAIADIIATLKGPMKAIATGLFELPNKPVEILALRLTGYSIGLGDLIVYSTLPTSVFVNLGPLQGIATLLAIPLGVYLSALWASKRGIVPALPFPVTLMSIIIAASLAIRRERRF